MGNNNPGFTTGNDTVKGQQGGMAVSQGGFDFGKWVQSLTQQLTTPNNNSNSQGGMAVSNPDNSVLPPTQQILQDTARKTYTKAIQDHADQTPPQVLGALLDSWGQQGGTQVPYSSPTGSNPNMATAQSAQLTNTIPQQNNSINNPGDPIQEQAQKVALQKPGLLMSIFRGTFEDDKETQLKNLELAQKITQGGPPLSPDQKTQAIGNWNSALLKQHQDYQQDLSEQMKSNTEGLDALIKNTPTPSKLTDWTNYNKQIQNYQTNIQNIASRQSQGFNKYIKLKLTNPVDSSQLQNNIKEGRTATNQKTGKKIVFRGGKWMNQ